MNIIFLDFDDVITTPNSEYTPILEKIELIRYILDATGFSDCTFFILETPPLAVRSL